MYDIIAKTGVPCYFIRYNPDSKNPNKSVFLEIINNKLNINIDAITNVFNEYGFAVEYLYYD